jgi:hypothetical protein
MQSDGLTNLAMKITSIKLVSRQAMRVTLRVGQGLCALCESPRVTATFCETHRQQRNAYARSRPLPGFRFNGLTVQQLKEKYPERFG